MEQWFSSDHHFGHHNIIRFSDRPFADVREMDEALIEYHNLFVKPSDHWTCLGDITMARGGGPEQQKFIALVKRLNGHKRIHLGNHDHFPIKTYLEAGFEKVYATNRTNGGILMSHIPIHPRSMGSARANVHGHIHTQPDYEPVLQVRDDGRVLTKPYINISVEVTNYHPVTLGWLDEQIKLRGGV